ncbi:MAG: YDG domain-containing protein [Oscillospiraceae bacterium]|nr:YDG domain-containing protein [Oscillospiraceae bacterium]
MTIHKPKLKFTALVLALSILFCATLGYGAWFSTYANDYDDPNAVEVTSDAALRTELTDQLKYWRKTTVIPSGADVWISGTSIAFQNAHATSGAEVLRVYGKLNLEQSLILYPSVKLVVEDGGEVIVFNDSEIRVLPRASATVDHNIIIKSGGTLTLGGSVGTARNGNLTNGSIGITGANSPSSILIEAGGTLNIGRTDFDATGTLNNGGGDGQNRYGGVIHNYGTINVERGGINNDNSEDTSKPAEITNYATGKINVSAGTSISGNPIAGDFKPPTISLSVPGIVANTAYSHQLETAATGSVTWSGFERYYNSQTLNFSPSDGVLSGIGSSTTGSSTFAVTATGDYGSHTQFFAIPVASIEFHEQEGYLYEGTAGTVNVPVTHSFTSTAVELKGFDTTTQKEIDPPAGISLSGGLPASGGQTVNMPIAASTAAKQGTYPLRLKITQTQGGIPYIYYAPLEVTVGKPRYITVSRVGNDYSTQAGTAKNFVYSVDMLGIPGKTYTAADLNLSFTPALPADVTASLAVPADDGSSKTSTLTLNITSAITTGDYHGTITIDGVKSNSFGFTVGKASTTNTGGKNFTVTYGTGGVNSMDINLAEQIISGGLSQYLFEFDSGAGARSYTIEDNSTGAGTINNATNILTVTKCGTFVISVETAATASNGAADKVTSTLTVNPKRITNVPGISEESTRVYDGETKVTLTINSAIVGWSDKVNTADDVAYHIGTLAGEMQTPNVGLNPITITGALGLVGDDAWRYVLTPSAGFPPLSLNITRKPITFNGTVTVEKEYDGTNAFTNDKITINQPRNFTGVIAGDIVELSAAGVTFTSSSLTAGGPYTTSRSGTYSLTGPQAGNYSIDSTTISAPATIFQTAANNTPKRPIDGVNPNPYEVTYGSGGVASMDFDLEEYKEELFTFGAGAGAGTRTYTIEGGTGAGTISGSTLKVTRTGTFHIGVVTAASTNHWPSQKVVSEFKVNPKLVTDLPTISAESKPYDGNTNIELTLSKDIDKVNSADDIQFVNNFTGTADSKDVGNDIDVDVTGNLLIFGADTWKYTLSTQPTTTVLKADITPKEITFVGTITAEKVFNNTVAFTNVQIEIEDPGDFAVGEVISGDDVVLSKTGVTLTATGSAVGTYSNIATPPTLTVNGSFSLTGTHAGNYSLLNASSIAVSAEIIRDSAVNTGDKEYTVTYGTDISSMTINLEDIRNELFVFGEGADAGARSYSIEDGGTGTGTISGNNLNVTACGTFEIGVITGPTTNFGTADKVISTLTVSPMIITAADLPVLSATNKTYDGNGAITITISPTTVPNSAKAKAADTVSFVHDYEGTADRNAGDDKAVAITGSLSLGGTDAWMYELDEQPDTSDVTVNIEPKEISFAGLVTAEKEYDGTDTFTSAQITVVTNSFGLGDIIGSDVVRLSAANVTLISTGTDVGSYSTSQSGDYTLSGTHALNYSLLYADNISASAEITKRGIGGTVGISVTHAVPGSGIIIADDTLKVDTTALTPANLVPTLDYQWFRNGVEIPGETTDSYIVDATDDPKGTKIHVEVTATGNFKGELTSGDVEIGKIPLVNDISITFPDNEDLGVGTELTVGGDVINGLTDGNHYEIKWYRDDVELSGETGTTYIITEDDLGTTISVEVTGIGDYSGTVGENIDIIVPFEIHYHNNFGDNETHTDDVLGGDEYYIMDRGESFSTRNGYRLTRWTTEKDGTGTSYAPDENISRIIENITLYAQWAQVISEDTKNKIIIGDGLTDAVHVFENKYILDLEQVLIDGHELDLMPAVDAMLLSGYPGYGNDVGDAVEGSVIITLYKEFLTFLPNGSYTLSVKFLYEEPIDIEFLIEHYGSVPDNNEPDNGGGGGGSGSGGGGSGSGGGGSGGGGGNSPRVPERVPLNRNSDDNSPNDDNNNDTDDDSDENDLTDDDNDENNENENNQSDDDSDGNNSGADDNDNSGNTHFGDDSGGNYTASDDSDNNAVATDSDSKSNPATGVREVVWFTSIAALFAVWSKPKIREYMTKGLKHKS